MSPMRRIPFDVLEQIFIACLPAHRNCVMSAQEAPVLLGRVCSSWRTLAFSAPRLWSLLHIALPNPDDSSASRDVCAFKLAQRLEVASAWLGRSGNCPLSVSVERNVYTRSAAAFDTDAQDDVLELLVPYASRWHDISLPISSPGYKTLSELSEDDVPLLRSLSLSLPDINSEFTWSPSGILHAVNLSRFEFAGGGVIPSGLPLRWNTLTHLSLKPSSWNTQQNLTCETALDILSKCHALRRCQLLIQGVAEFQVLPTDVTIQSSLLRVFELECYKTPIRTSEYLLNHFSHLELEEFSLVGSADWEDPDNIQDLTSALVRCPQLRSVVIQGDVFSRIFLADLIRGLPSTVQRLKMFCVRGWDDDSLDNDVLQVLEACADRPVGCPGLRQLILQGVHLITDDALLHFTVSRSPTLRLLDVTFSRERQVDILPNLQQFINAGLEISLRYPPREPAFPQFSPWQGLSDSPSHSLRH
ncbi:hypothetical protein R3P38DRAFT_3041045 [Favolaschia claudopus]|uniref:F-box domain-containing protein n=1 Tax=Favolaschia claudopus TaxID=2862362 RepID=A0AAW0AB28_9AGAR